MNFLKALFGIPASLCSLKLKATLSACLDQQFVVSTKLGRNGNTVIIKLAVILKMHSDWNEWDATRSARFVCPELSWGGMPVSRGWSKSKCSYFSYWGWSARDRHLIIIRNNFQLSTTCCPIKWEISIVVLVMFS